MLNQKYINVKRPHLLILLVLGMTIFSYAFTVNSSNSSLIFQDKPWVADASSKKLKNPTAGEKSSIKKGKALYASRCVICHGEGGTGDGPGSKALNPKPANHTSKKVQDQTDGELFWKISEGRGAMVGWKLIIAEEDRWHLVNYIRTLKSN